MNLSRRVELDTARALRADHHGLRRRRKRSAIEPRLERLLQVDVDDLVGARRQRPVHARRFHKSAAFAKGANDASQRRVRQHPLLDLHRRPPTGKPEAWRTDLNLPEDAMVNPRK